MKSILLAFKSVIFEGPLLGSGIGPPKGGQDFGADCLLWNCVRQIGFEKRGPFLATDSVSFFKPAGQFFFFLKKGKAYILIATVESPDLVGIGWDQRHQVACAIVLLIAAMAAPRAPDPGHPPDRWSGPQSSLSTPRASREDGRFAT